VASFEFKTEIEREVDGETVTEPITLRFRRYGDAPGRISRHNQGNIERQVWLYFEWGLIDPKNWPEDSELPGHRIFDVLPQRVITKIYREWQASEDKLAEEEDKDR
jgi:hypothetical protein